MRAPPPVETACMLGRSCCAALAALAGLAAAVPLAWGLPYAAAQWGNPSGAPLEALGIPLSGVVLAVAVMTSGAFWLTLRRVDEAGRMLRWDGQDWSLAFTDGQPDLRGNAALMLDLGPWMLVRFVPAAARGARAARWLVLTSTQDAARWAGLRGALWNWRAARGNGRR
jgi:hypothetical protein